VGAIPQLGCCGAGVGAARRGDCGGAGVGGCGAGVGAVHQLGCCGAGVGCCGAGVGLAIHSWYRSPASTMPALIADHVHCAPRRTTGAARRIPS